MPLPPPSAAPRRIPLALEAELLSGVGEVARESMVIERSLTEAQAKESALALEVLKARQHLAAVQDQHGAVVQQEAQASQRLRRTQRTYAGLARLRYKQQQSWLAAFLDAQDFGGFLQRLAYLAIAQDRERDLAQRIQSDRAALQKSAATLAQLEQRAGQDAQALERAQEELARQQQQEQMILASLQQTLTQALEVLADVGTLSPTLLQMKAELTTAQARALTVQARATVWAQASPLGLRPGTNEEAITVTVQSLQALAGDGRAALRWPVPEGILTQKFGPSPYAFEPPYASIPHFHTGIDLAALPGTPVLAAADGTVLLSDAQRYGNAYVGYGRYVLLQHAGGVRTLYAHLLGSTVRPGDVLHQGQVLGFVGSTGNSTGPHTHFEVRVENAPIDPFVLLPRAR